MYLELESGRIFEMVSEEDLRAVIDGEENAILGWNSNTYIQCAERKELPHDYVLEYQAGSLDKHYQAVDSGLLENATMLAQPVALVTGGSRGLGRGICAALARRGYAVAVNYAGNEEAARATQQLLGDNAVSLLCQGDISVDADRRRLVQTVLAAWDRLDVLVNNAGITSVGRRDILEATEDSWERVLGVNLKGPFFLSQLAAVEMIQRLPQLTNPAIVNISSLSAYAVSTNRGDYCISKAGLAMLTQLFAARLAEHGIRVFEVRPGIMETDMTAGAHEKYTRLIAEGLTPIRRWGTAEDVGEAVAALATGALPFCTGEVLNIDGGFHIRRLPP